MAHSSLTEYGSKWGNRLAVDVDGESRPAVVTAAGVGKAVLSGDGFVHASVVLAARPPAVDSEQRPAPRPSGQRAAPAGTQPSALGSRPVPLPMEHGLVLVPRWWVLGLPASGRP